MVPSSLEALVFESELGRLVLLEQAEGNATQGGEVLGAVVSAQARVVFAESDIEHPMGGVFGLPMFTDSMVDIRGWRPWRWSCNNGQ